ncbi:alpha carbonic anhydrase 8 [Oreochromis niloticus]|uniref:alpha carbonic anhydrase 8 n=1 Tax=Oreochromis niloticus TaxID=8128 RepID=UPI000394694B|nr:alpha carbonic anhydrase 8 [Oreochromis niloticus]
MHPPTTSATHQPGPKPPRPSQNPSPEVEHPKNPGAGCQAGNQGNTTQDPQKPHPGQDHSPHAKPHKKPTPREPTHPPTPTAMASRTAPQPHEVMELMDVAVLVHVQVPSMCFQMSHSCC